jgi:hypothetical protein
VQHRAAVLMGFALFCFSAFAQSATITGGQLRATGLTPNGDAVVFGVGVRPAGYESAMERTLKTVTADAGGAVSFAPDHGLPSRGVWFVIDLKTGRLLSAAPDGSPARVRDVTKDVIIGSGVTRFTAPFSQYATAVLIRPPNGIWQTSAGDGGTNDDDHRPDAAVTLAFTRFAAHGQSAAAAPANLTPGDVLVVIDFTTLTAYTVAVPRGRQD